MNVRILIGLSVPVELILSYQQIQYEVWRTFAIGKLSAESFKSERETNVNISTELYNVDKPNKNLQTLKIWFYEKKIVLIIFSGEFASLLMFLIKLENKRRFI